MLLGWLAEVICSAEQNKVLFKFSLQAELDEPARLTGRLKLLGWQACLVGWTGWLFLGRSCFCPAGLGLAGLALWWWLFFFASFYCWRCCRCFGRGSIFIVIVLMAAVLRLYFSGACHLFSISFCGLCSTSPPAETRLTVYRRLDIGIE